VLAQRDDCQLAVHFCHCQSPRHRLSFIDPEVWRFVDGTGKAICDQESSIRANKFAESFPIALIVDVKSAGKFAGQSLLVLQLDRIAVGSKNYSLQTDQCKRQGNSRGKNTATRVGAGAVIGAIIGGIAGGGKGAGIGALAGGGVGGGVQAATKGQQIKLPSETVLNFTLQGPLTVVPTTQGPNATRSRAANQ
jgi:hypothetical protein